MISATTAAQAVNNVRAQFVAIHEEIYGTSLWRTLRRLIPLPGLFEAIPYDKHAVRLGALVHALQGVREDTGRPRGPNLRPANQDFFAQLDAYVGALLDAMGRLRDICVAMQAKAEGSPGPTFAEYNVAVAAYEAARRDCSRLGGPLQLAFSRAASEV